MAKKQTRADRWWAAVGEARRVLDEMRDLQEELQAALEGVADVKSEYTDWYENMPEGLQDNSPTGEKLSAINDIDLDVSVELDEYEEAIAAAENADLPRGFGRD